MKLVIFLIALIILISGCVQSTQPSIVEDFTFNSGNGTCGSGESNAEIKLIDNKITFSGYVGTSTPCYKLKASYLIEKINPEKGPETDVIIITITKEGIGEVCVQCIGKVSFNGEILINKEMWQVGHYGIEIMYEGKELARLYSYVV